MNTIVKALSFFCLGAASGFFIGDFVAKRKMSEEYRRETEEAVQRAYSQYKTCENAEKAKKRVEKAIDGTSQTRHKPSQNASKIDLNGPRIDSNKRVTVIPGGDVESIVERSTAPRIPSREGKRVMIEYSKIYSNPGEPTDTEEEDLELDGDEMDELESSVNVVFEDEIESAGIGSGNDICAVPKTLYDSDSDFFDREMLFLYADDLVVCDENDTTVDDVEDVLGFSEPEILTMLKNRVDGTIYIRNIRFRTYYEVRFIQGSFKSLVSSRIETDREREARRLRRIKETDPVNQGK